LPSVTWTVYEPDVVTLIVWVVALPGVQRLPVALEDVRLTLPPVQNVVGPPGVMVGVGGSGLTVTTTGAEGAEEQPAVVTVTV
jgi:hypothetical protein